MVVANIEWVWTMPPTSGRFAMMLVWKRHSLDGLRRPLWLASGCISTMSDAFISS